MSIIITKRGGLVFLYKISIFRLVDAKIGNYVDCDFKPNMSPMKIEWSVFSRQWQRSMS